MSLFDDELRPAVDVAEPSPPIVPHPFEDRVPGPDDTVADARTWVQACSLEGVNCPVCGQRAQTYRRKITGRSARALVTIYRAGGLDFVHVPTVLGGQVQRADEAKMVHWGLIEEEKTLRPDGGRAGWWRVTPKGLAFMRGEVEVKKYALIYDSRCVGQEGEWVSFEDCLGVPFDLAELLEGR